MKVFWSWQSDSPGRVGRFFVRDALKVAIQELQQEPDVDEAPEERATRNAMHPDQDRQGVPGTPDLAPLIFDKITHSAVFIADVTLVGTVLGAEGAAEPPKKLINSNVAIELGYAFKAVPSTGILMIMNEHYGTRSDLPFDLAHKAGPIMYRLAPNADNPTVAAASIELKINLKNALKEQLKSQVQMKREATSFPEASRGRDFGKYFARAEAVAEIGTYREHGYTFTHDRYCFLRLFPKYAVSDEIPSADMMTLFEKRKLGPFSLGTGGLVARNKYGTIIFDPSANNEILGLTQGFATGELWGVNGQLFKQKEQVHLFGDGDRVITVIPAIAFEEVFLRALASYVETATIELALSPPFVVECGAVGLTGVYLGIPGKGDFEDGPIGPIHKSEVVHRDELSHVEDNATKTVLRKFFDKLYDAAGAKRSQTMTQEFAESRGLPAL